MTQTMTQSRVENGSQTGFLLVGMLATILPLMILVGAAGSLMVNRNQELLQRMHLEQAFLAAESGIDEAVFKISNGSLPSGVQYKRQLAPDHSFTVDPLDLGSDGVDNDGDTLVDEPDENIMQIVVTGFYLNHKRRLVAYLEPNMMSISLPGAMTFQDNDPQVEIDTPFFVSGIDTNLDGTPGPGPNTYGISVLNGSVAGILSELSNNSGSVVTGLGPSPSVGVTSDALDIAAIRAAVIANADIVITNRDQENVVWGDSSIGDWKIVYVPGRLRIEVSGRGAGILLVDDRFEIRDTFEWHGLIIVMGEMEFESDKDSVLIRGGFVSAPSGEDTEIEDSVTISYSTEALNAISTLLPSTGGNYHVSGWKEISTK